LDPIALKQAIVEHLYRQGRFELGDRYCASPPAHDGGGGGGGGGGVVGGSGKAEDGEDGGGAALESMAADILRGGGGGIGGGDGAHGRLTALGDLARLGSHPSSAWPTLAAADLGTDGIPKLSGGADGGGGGDVATQRGGGDGGGGGGGGESGGGGGDDNGMLLGDGGGGVDVASAALTAFREAFREMHTVSEAIEARQLVPLAAGTDGQCAPRHQTHVLTLFFDVNDML